MNNKYLRVEIEREEETFFRDKILNLFFNRAISCVIQNEKYISKLRKKKIESTASPTITGLLHYSAIPKTTLNHTNDLDKATNTIEAKRETQNLPAA